MSKKKEITNEGIFGAARKFTNAFFDGLKSGSADKIIRQAKKAGMERDAIEKMERIKQDQEELQDILDKYPLKPKK